MVLVAGGQCRDVAARRLLHLRTVQRQRAGAAAVVAEAADCRADAHVRAELRAVGADLQRVAVFPHRPVRHRMDEFGDHGLDAVRGGKIHLPVVIRPVIDSRRGLDRAPHEPVPEDVEAVFAGDAVIALPILLRRIGLAEIDRAVRQLEVGSQHASRLLRKSVQALRNGAGAASACCADRGSAPPRSGCACRPRAARCRSARPRRSRRCGRDASPRRGRRNSEPPRCRAR